MSKIRIATWNLRLGRTEVGAATGDPAETQ